MKQIYKLFLSVLFIFMVTLLFTTENPVYANNSEKTLIKVAYTKNYGVLDNPESLDYKGFGYEILIRSEHYSNYKFEFIEYEYYEAIAALKDGTVDLMGVVFESDLYSEDFLYVPKVLGTTQLILVSKNDNYYYDDPASIDGKVVASFHNNPYEQYLNEYCEQNGISVSYVRDDIDKFIDLKADLYLTTTIDYNVKDDKMVINLYVFDMYFMTTKENEQLSNAIADAIELSVSADGTFLEQLQIKYYGSKNIIRRYLTRQEVELLTSRPLSCGYIDHHQPIQFTNENGEADGISFQIMDMLSKQYGFEIDFVPYNHDMPLHSHEHFDLLISATGDFEHEMEFYTTSAPFWELPMMLFADNDVIENITSEDHHSKLGIINYITIDKDDIESRYPNNTVIFYDTFDEVLDAFIKGELDGFFATDIGIEYAQTLLGTENYAISSSNLALPLRLFISRDIENLTEYLGAFNVMFEHLDQNKIDQIISTQIVGFLPEYSAATFVKENLDIFILALIGVMLIVLYTVIYVENKKKKAILKILNHDSLTNLISQYNFNQQVKDILKTAEPGEYEVISLDIDSFHTINSVYSQEKGNQVLASIADVLLKQFKGSNAFISRIIADQFIVFHKVNDGLSIKKICEQDITSALKMIMGEKYNISMSIGICVVEDPTQRIDKIVDCAVSARLKGKRKYSFTYNMYNDALKKENELKTDIVYRMKDALIDGQFKVVYQPKINLNSLKIGGAEALVRWHTDSDLGIIPPNVFISIFESNGFIVDLDICIFEQVCRFIAENEKNLTIPLISINVSNITLFDDKFPFVYLEILSKYNLSPNKVEIEITESAIGIEQSILIEKLEEIRNKGLFISIDDFGSGESSLNRLSSIPAHTLKLDKAFLDYNIADDKGAIVVENVIKLAKQLDMNVVCEGVETKEQSVWLKSLNCDLAQGYYFARPMSQQDFTDLLNQDKQYEI